MSNKSNTDNNTNENKSPFPAKGNPYTILSLPNFATQSQIKKSFRQLSLKYHPDKREQNLSKAQHDNLDHQFISVQEARDFLLNTDFKHDKNQFDAKLKSETLRKQEEERRDAAMSSKRKRMRHDLESKIQNLKTDAGGGAGAGVDDGREEESQGYQDLKRDGVRMREEFGQRTRTAEEKLAARARKKQKSQLENRQVRVKWSRKKMGGQSDEMIAKLMKRFGALAHVELIGAKGNSALVTFQDDSSCKPCVDFYLHSDELRASYVNVEKRKDEEGSIPLTDTLNRDRDRESVEERKLRQAAEREVLLRNMELGEENDQEESGFQGNKEMKDDGLSSKKLSHLFPPTFPACKQPTLDGSLPSPLERLQLLEREILQGLLSSREIEDIQILIR
jgi:DnaJ family protein C protein 17